MSRPNLFNNNVCSEQVALTSRYSSPIALKYIKSANQNLTYVLIIHKTVPIYAMTQSTAEYNVAIEKGANQTLSRYMSAKLAGE